MSDGPRSGEMSRVLSLIGAPSSAGAYAPGQEKAPAAFRRHGLISALTRAGHEVRDRGDVAPFRWRPDPTRPRAMNLGAVRQTATAVAAHVAEAMSKDDNVLVLGGDCTIELGTVAGALNGDDSVGVIYIDLDVDLNNPQQSDGALDWTGVAHLLGLPGVTEELSAIGTRKPMLAPADILFFAADNITASEAEVIKTHRLETIRLSDVQSDPVAAAKRAVTWAALYRRLLVHLDVDVLAYTDFPIAENVRRCPGLRFDELASALGILLAAPNWRALTLAEINPDHAPDEAETFRRLIAMLADVLPV